MIVASRMCRLVFTFASCLVVALGALGVAPAGAAPAAPAPTRPTTPMHLVDQFAIGGEGAWGDLDYDAATHRLFIARAKMIQVVDTESRKVLKEIPCADGPHGMALAHDLRRGYLSSLSDTTVLVFDLDGLVAVQTTKVVPPSTGTLVYDASSHRVFVLDPNGTVTALDAKTGEVVGTRSLAARPQGAVADGAGALFVAIPEQDAVAVLDARTLLERTRWTLDAGSRPAALAYDAANRRLFCGGKGLWLTVLETDRGSAVARLAVGGGVEKLVFDPGKHLLVSIGAGGASSTMWQESADKYSMVATIGTHSGARTIALDADHHVAYVVSAEMLRSGRSTKPGAHAEFVLVPNGFTVFVLKP